MTRLARLLLPALLLAALPGCSSGGSAGPAPAPVVVTVSSDPVSFRAASGRDFAVGSTFEGTYVMGPERVVVLVTRATLRLRDVGGYRGPRRVTTIRAGLGQGSTASQWRMTNESAPVVIDRVLRPGEEVTLDSLTFQIPIRRAPSDLGRRWVVLEVGAVTEGAGGGVPGTSYAHTPRFDGTPP